MMTRIDMLALLPWLVLAATVVAVMLLIAWRRSHRATATLTGLGLILSLAALAAAWPHTVRQATPLFVVDGYALFYAGLVLASALLITLLSYDYLRARATRPEEYYLLLLLATLGAAVMVASSHLAAFFLGLETLSIALLGLIGYPRHSELPLEASLKYLILSGIASAFVLFGIALVYADLGSLSFEAAAGKVPLPELAQPGRSPYWLIGVALILTGVGFKLSVFPFHLWAPDVYQGAPAPVTAFVAVVSKCAMVALLLRYLSWSDALQSATLTTIVSALAVLSMLAGNLLALLQVNIKRILAYSSIAHLGYVLVAVLAGGTQASEAVSVYLTAYAAMTLGAFAVITQLSQPAAQRDADTLEDYRGLFWQRPWLAAAFALMLLSLAGVPLTLGFIAKFYAVSAGVAAGLAIPVAALVLGSIVALYYYLRIIVAMLAPEAPSAAPAQRLQSPHPRLGQAVLALVSLLLIGFGTYPAPLIEMVRASAAPTDSSASSDAAASVR